MASKLHEHPAASGSNTTQHSVNERIKEFQRRRSLPSDLFDPNLPWVLCDNGSFLGLFDFVPDHFRHGPWHVGPTLALGFVVYLVILAHNYLQLHAPPNGWIAQFNIPDNEEALAFSHDWYYNLVIFGWMLYICFNVIFQSPLSIGAWISFTLWSWTVITVRHGLCVLAPFLPRLRVVSEVLRFPVLLSASMTTMIWNFILMPAISIWFLDSAQKRKQFWNYMTSFRLTQLHVFNLAFAIANSAYAGPLRPLHLADLAAGIWMMVIYMGFYYLILDRLGMHLYPIFSPRSVVCIPSLALIVAAIFGGFYFWQRILESNYR